MSTQFFAEPEKSQNLKFGPLSCHIPAFTSSLYEQGYASTSIHGKMMVVRNFSRWIEKRQLMICELDEWAISDFFEDHPRAGYVRRGDLATLLSLLEWLRDTGIIPKLLPEVEDSKLHRIECDFVQYLEKERGLSQPTLRR